MCMYVLNTWTVCSCNCHGNCHYLHFTDVKLSNEERTFLAQGYIAGKWKCRNSNSGNLAPKPVFLTSIQCSSQPPLVVLLSSHPERLYNSIYVGITENILGLSWMLLIADTLKPIQTEWYTPQQFHLATWRGSKLSLWLVQPTDMLGLVCGLAWTGFYILISYQNKHNEI